MRSISERILILSDASLKILLERLRLWLRTWTVSLPARETFTRQDDSDVNIQWNLRKKETSQKSNELIIALVPTLCMLRLRACTIFVIKLAWLFPQCGSSSTAVDWLKWCAFSMKRSSMQMFDFISCVVLYRFVYQSRLTYLFCVVN